MLPLAYNFMIKLHNLIMTCIISDFYNFANVCALAFVPNIVQWQKDSR